MRFLSSGFIGEGRKREIVTMGELNWELDCFIMPSSDGASRTKIIKITDVNIFCPVSLTDFTSLVRLSALFHLYSKEKRHNGRIMSYDL